MIIFIDYYLFKIIIKCWLCSVCCTLCVCAQSFSGVWLFETPWTIAFQALLSVNCPGTSTGAGCHFLLQGMFPTQMWIKSAFLAASPVLAGRFFTAVLQWEAHCILHPCILLILCSSLYSYLLIPFSPFVCLALPPSGNHSLVLYIHDSVCFVICVCLFAFCFIYL